jgi:hypothetical protein
LCSLWRLRNDDGTLTGTIPLLSSQVSYIGMTADHRDENGYWNSEIMRLPHETDFQPLEFVCLPVPGAFAPAWYEMRRWRFRRAKGPYHNSPGCEPRGAKSGRPVLILYFDHNFCAGRLYRETIQHFDPKRHRPYAPATYFASDTGDDYFHELMQEHEVWKNRKTIWEKVSQSAVNDFGDCEKIGLVQDWCVRMSKDTPPASY